MNLEKIKVERLQDENGKIYESEGEAIRNQMTEAISNAFKERLCIKEFDRNASEVWNFASFLTRLILKDNLDGNTFNDLFSSVDIESLKFVYVDTIQVRILPERNL